MCDLEVYIAIHVDVNKVWAMSVLVDTWLISLISYVVFQSVPVGVLNLFLYVKW